jgi:sec-independent protein translocase protein TatB
MNILGMGPTEILLIVVLALIVFGPARLPEIMGQVGRAIADFRRATSALSDEFNRTIQSELNETKAVVDETRAVLNDAKSTVTQTHAAVSSAVAVSSPTPAPQLVAAPPVAAPNGTSEAHTAANGTGVSSVPPMADTTQWSWETSTPSSSGPESAAEEASEKPAPRPAREQPQLRDELLPPY